MTAYQFDREPRVFDTEDKVKIPTGINIPPTGWYLSELSHFIRCAEQGVPSHLVSCQQVLTVIELLETQFQNIAVVLCGVYGNFGMH